MPRTDEVIPDLKVIVGYSSFSSIFKVLDDKTFRYSLNSYRR